MTNTDPTKNRWPTRTQQKTDDQHEPNKKNVLELMSSRIASSYYFLLDIRYEK